MTADDVMFNETTCANCTMQNVLVMHVATMPHTWESGMWLCEECIIALFLEQNLKP